MSFASANFVVFFAIYMCFFFWVPQRWRWAYILAASYYFYMCARPEYVLLLAATTTIDYFAALLIERSTSSRSRKALLVVSLATNLGVLALFKYAKFFADLTTLTAATDLLPKDSVLFQLLLPVGISFFTFQSMSYTIDVYRGVMPAERHWGKFAAFVAFFPQLVAGPIERASRLLPQLHRRPHFDPVLVSSGLRLMLLGFFKKLCVANQLDPIVNAVYASPERFGGGMHLVCTMMFALQIYCDFSGYTDIAIGAARIQGYMFSPNFLQPYFSSSFSEFWRRWHISLSSWFRDYLYISLGGGRGGTGRTLRNIAIVFLLSGFWHGANATFIAWGGLHAIYLCTEKLARDLAARFHAIQRMARTRPGVWLRRFAVFAAVCVAWVLFRASDLATALAIYKSMLHVAISDLDVLISPTAILPTTRANLLYLVFSSVILLAVDWCLYARPQAVVDIWSRPAIRMMCYTSLLYTIVFTGVFGAIKFIYFQF